MGIIVADLPIPQVELVLIIKIKVQMSINPCDVINISDTTPLAAA